MEGGDVVLPEEELSNTNERTTQKVSEGAEEEGEERVIVKKKREEEEKKRLDRLYAPPLPYPYRRIEKKLDEKFQKFLEHLQKLELKIPFLEAMAQMPKYAKFLKDLLTKKKLDEEVINVPHQASAIIQGSLPNKGDD